MQVAGRQHRETKKRWNFETILNCQLGVRVFTWGGIHTHKGRSSKLHMETRVIKSSEPSRVVKVSVDALHQAVLLFIFWGNTLIYWNRIDTNLWLEVYWKKGVQISEKSLKHHHLQHTGAVGAHRETNPVGQIDTRWKRTTTNKQKHLEMWLKR